MNLTTDSWIPIVWSEGQAGRVSLCGAFERGEEIRDLTVRPHERIALMRLLICIAQAALDGPADEDDWKACYSRIVPSALYYLRRWQHAFALFGNGQRFLQMPNLKRPPKKPSRREDEFTSTSKLDFALATGNNTTLFDNAGGSARPFAESDLALSLIAFQCFSPGGRIGVALWDGAETPGKGSSDHAPCLAGGMLHALVRGDHLLGTIHRNLMTKQHADQFYGPDAWGKPVWEMMPQALNDREAVRNAARTYLGRLLPLTRAIRLGDDGESLVLGNGLPYESFDAGGWREPTSTVVASTVKGESKRVLLRGSVERALWRELHALTVRAVGERPGGPAALQHLAGDQPFDLWVGSLVADQAKPVDTIESVFHVPGAMLDPDAQSGYEEGVRYSKRAEHRLHRAISTYRMAMESAEKDLDGISRGLGKLRRPEQQRFRQLSANARQQFWTEVELAVPRLLEVAENPEKLGLPPAWHKTEWGKAVDSAMRAAFELACPHDTPRQMRAYALGLQALFGKRAAQNAAEAEQEVEV
jgi:CRISPR system Cascade subunit CasA